MARTGKHTFRPDCESLEGRQLLATAALNADPTGLAVLSAQEIGSRGFELRVPGGTPQTPGCSSLALKANFALVSQFPVRGFGGATNNVPAAVLTEAPRADSALTTQLGLTTRDAITSLDGVPVGKECAELDAHIGPTTITFVRASAGENFERSASIFV